MYLNQNQVRIVLETPFFTVPVTSSIVTYTLYRGKYNSTVHTLRFNLNNASVNEPFITSYCTKYLDEYFTLHNRILTSINFDLLLSKDDENFYVWRANSNVSRFPTDDFMLIFTFDNVYRLVTKAINTEITELNAYFLSSSITVKKILSIVISFVKL